ncbi:MAG: small basic family protein [Firmicutes bacterium]|nr:small basic family protein [Bacillota bacterium]
MWLPAIGLLLGVLIGLRVPLVLPTEYSGYLAVGILAALDSVFGGLRAALEGDYKNRVFVTGFFANSVLAILLTYLGVRLGVDLVLGATVAFSIRIFNNLGRIRHQLLEAWPGHRQDSEHPPTNG